MFLLKWIMSCCFASGCSTFQKLVHGGGSKLQKAHKRSDAQARLGPQHHAFRVPQVIQTGLQENAAKKHAAHQEDRVHSRPLDSRQVNSLHRSTV